MNMKLIAVVAGAALAASSLANAAGGSMTVNSKAVVLAMSDEKIQNKLINVNKRMQDARSASEAAVLSGDTESARKLNKKANQLGNRQLDLQIKQQNNQTKKP